MTESCKKADSLFFKAVLNNATVSRDGELVKKLLSMCTGGLCEEAIVEHHINKMPIEILSFPKSKLYKDFPKYYNRFITRMAEEGKLSLWNRLYLFFTGNFELAFSFPKLKAEATPKDASKVTPKGAIPAEYTPGTQRVAESTVGLGI